LRRCKRNLKERKKIRGEYKIEKKLFDFKLIAIGLIFLIDFNVNTIDILPDFIALIFISAGIGRAYYVNENLAKVKNYINYFYIVALAKFIWNGIYLIPGLRMFGDSEILLLTTVFSGAEFILSLLIFSNIFRGFESFFQQGDLNEQSSFMEHAKKSDFILLWIKIFIIIKFIMAMIVQIPVLLTDETWVNLSIKFEMFYLDAAFVKGLFIPPCFIIQTLFGIFLLSIIMPYFFTVSKDNNLQVFLKSKINNMLLNDNLFNIKQTLNSAFLFFIIGCVFFIDLQFDNINILPDFVICIIFLAGVFIISRTNRDIKTKKLNIYFLINFPVSADAYITGTMYKIKAAQSFSDENIILLKNLKLSSTLFFHASVILFFLIFIEFYGFIKNYQRKNLEFSARYLNKYLTAAEKNFDKNRNNILRISAAAFCVKTITPVLPQSGIILFCHSMILITFVVFVIKGLYNIRDAVYSYYN